VNIAYNVASQEQGATVRTLRTLFFSDNLRYFAVRLLSHYV